MPSVWGGELEAKKEKTLTCQRCRRPFSFKPTLKFPGWEPKYCIPCKNEMEELEEKRIRFRP